MFKIEGSVRGVLRDINTGVTRELPLVNNHIQDSFLRSFFSVTPNILSSLGINLFVSEYNPGRQRRDLESDLTEGWSRQGSDISGVNKTVVTYNDAPGVHLIQMTQRFTPPSTDFNINTVGLCTAVVATGTTEVTGLTNIVWLETPCIQTTTESLDLFYRIQVRFDPNYLSNTQNSRNITPAEAKIVTDGLAKVNTDHLILGSFSSTIIAGFLSMSKVNSRKLLVFAASVSTAPTTLTLNDKVQTPTEEFFKSGISGVNRLSDNIGIIVSHMGSGPGKLYYKSVDENTSPIQSVFGHRDTSITPFYVSSTSQVSLGGVVVNGDSWTDPNHPKYFKIDIDTSGLEGVSAYKFRVRSSYSFSGNTFTNLTIPLHWSLSDNMAMHDNFVMQKSDYGSAYPIYYSKNIALFTNINEVAKVDMLTGDSTVINNLTLVGTDLAPRFLATAICQTEVSPLMDTFVACKNTGIYKFNEKFDELDIINSSVTGLENTLGCYGVHVGMGGRIWGYFSHTTQNSLYYSDDAGTSWTKTTLVDADLDAILSNILYIHSDTQNHNVAIMYLSDISDDLSTNNSDIGIKWWNHNTSTVTSGPARASAVSHNFLAGYKYFSGDINGFQKIITCSPNDSVWASCYGVSSVCPALFTFESDVITRAPTSLNLRVQSFFTNWSTDTAGNDVLHYISDLGDGGTQTENRSYSVYLNLSTLSYESVVIRGGIITETTSTFTVDSEGMWLINSSNINTASGMFSLNPIGPQEHTPAATPIHHQQSYPEYGWNGTSWEKGNPNSKLTHSAAEDLIEGITIAFNDNSGVTSFFDSDHYTFGVVDGIWADGFTTYEHSWEAYSKATIVNTEIESSTLPVVTKVSNILQGTTTDDIAFYQDLESTDVPAEGQLQATGTGLDGDYNAGARSVNPIINGSLSPFIPFAVIVPNTDIKNAQGYVEGELNSNNNVTTARTQFYFGLSVVGKLGTSLDASTINYTIHVDSETTEALAVGDKRYASIKVVENGIERAVYPSPLFIPFGGIKFRIVLRNNGSVAYLVEVSSNFWETIYQSPVGSVTVEDLYLDIAYVPTNNYGLKNLAFYSLTTNYTDYYMYLGNGSDQGVYHSEFVAIDPDTIKLQINGVDAIMVGRDDSDSILAANSYSVYPYAGVIRFSAFDTGLPVTAEYVTIVNE